MQDELGLNFYDYGARNYNPALGRFMTIDPLAELTRKFNPYTYALDNPVYFIDPDGREANTFFQSKFLNQNGGHWSDQYRSGDTSEDNSEGSTSENSDENTSSNNGIDPPKKKKQVDPQSPEEQEKWRKYNEEKLLPLNKVLLVFATVGRVWETGVQGLYLRLGTTAELAPLVVNSETRVTNTKGVPYPKVTVEGYGEVPFPEGPFTPNNSSVLRGAFTPKLKGEFKEWWIGEGRVWPKVPEGSTLNIHHIKSLSHGGTNAFENLIPLIQPEQHQPFTNWWRAY